MFNNSNDFMHWKLLNNKKAKSESAFFSSLQRKIIMSFKKKNNFLIINLKLSFFYTFHLFKIK